MLQAIKTLILALLITFSFLAVSKVANADERLFTCKFPYFSSSDLKIEKSENFILRFVLKDDGTASIIGNSGAAPVMPFEDREKINLIEMTASGNIVFTTIDAFGTAVHSKHTVIGTLVPSQYYGTCLFQ